MPLSILHLKNCLINRKRDMCDIYGHQDIDDIIYKELHKINLTEIKQELLKRNTNELWKNPSEYLLRIVTCDRGAYQHFHNDLWFNLNNYNKNMALHDIYGVQNEYCLNCEHYGLPCRNCCYCFPSLNTFEIFQANFSVRDTNNFSYYSDDDDDDDDDDPLP